MVGNPDTSGVISEPVNVIVVVAVLLAELPSLVAPVVPVRFAVAAAIGVPETVHVITPLGASVAGLLGEHTVVSPAGKPATAHVGDVAASAGATALVHVNVPLYGVPTLPVVGSPARLMLMSEPVVAMATVVWLLPPVPVPPLVSLVAPVVTVAVTLPEVVGVPLTGHEMLAPTATLAGGTGEQVPTVTPGGSPVTEQVAERAEAVAVALLVHVMVPL